MSNMVAQRKRNRRAETGIAIPEIMVIISLIVILAMLSYPRYYDSLTKASRDGSLVATDAIVKALAMYQLDKRYYPNSIQELGTYTNTTNLQTPFTNLTLVVRGTGMCVEGGVSGIGSVSAGEEYRVANCYGVNGLKPGGYCCMSPNAKTGTSDCTVSGSYDSSSNWYECKKRLY